MHMVMIGVHKDLNDNIIGFRIMDTETNKIKDVGYNEVKAILIQGTHSIENLKVEKNEVQGANGTLTRFPTIVNGRIQGTSPLVVLEELPDKHYKVTNYAGQIVEISEDKAVEYSNNYSIANGKIVTDKDTGKQYISSISGNYKQNKMIRDIKAGAKLSLKMSVIGEDRYGLDDRQFAYAKDKSITELRLGRGVLGIKQEGFKRCRSLKSIELPQTLNTLEPASFFECDSLEIIEIPEGVTKIPHTCFAKCRNLRTIKLPNTLREIGYAAFTGCDNLTVIYAGPEKIDVTFGAIPRGVRWVRREVKTGGQKNDTGIEATMVAVKYDRNTPSQYRIFDANGKGNNKVMDIPGNLLLDALKNDKIQVSNLIESNGQLVCTNGQFDGYPIIDMDNNLISGDTAPFVVINKLGDKGYTISDLNGKTLKLTTSDAVKLAKDVGVSNGRIVTVDGIEIIATLGDPYKTVTLTESKVGNTSEDVDISIGIKNRSKGFKGGTQVDVSVEINENDVFSVMTPEQKRVLKNYYVQYTLDLYETMAKSVRLNLAPGKTERLAELRGELDWEFAGVWDTGFLGASHCELGHALRYEYYAVPSKVGIQRRRSKMDAGTYDKIDEVDHKIVFGETCASDFFNISEENMKQLVRTRKTMSDEIKLMSDIITNKLEKEYVNKLLLMYMLIRKLNTQDRIKEAFGNYLGETLIDFIRTEMPFTRTLVIECSKHVNKNPKKFFTLVFPEYTNVLESIYTRTDSSLHETTKLYLNFITENKIEGEYAYNPLVDAKDNQRRDIGRYNKETRNERRAFNRFIQSYSMCKDYTYEELINILDLIKSLEELNSKVYNRFEANDILKNRLEDISKYSYDYVEYMEDYTEEQAAVRTTLLNAILLDNRYNIEYDYRYSSIRTYVRSMRIKSRYDNTPYEYVGKYNRLYKHSYVKNAIRDIEILNEYGDEQAIKDFIQYCFNDIKQKKIEEQLEKERIAKEELERQRLEAERLRKEKEEAKRLEAERLEKLKNDKVYQLKLLMEKHSEFTENSTDYGIKVAKDIVSRGLTYGRLSSKQKWRINKELETYEALESGKTEEEIENGDKEVEVNNTYLLEEHPEIKEKVEKVQSKADSIEMQAVLEETPNVLKICYSIMRYGKASDRQLKHVYKALEILDQA